MRELFIFTKKERWGIITLLICIITAMISPAFFSNNHADAIEKWQIATIVLSDTTTPTPTSVANNKTNTTEPVLNLFYFDPNELSKEGFQQLGFAEKLIATIINYRNKGGRFYKPEDIQKIYGINQELADKIIPFIKIQSSEKQVSKFSNNNKPREENFYKEKTTGKININTADSVDFIQLKGIGPVIASRIIRYRERLGGFYSKTQLKEVYGLKEEVYDEILPMLSSNNEVRKINLNESDEGRLSMHPYIQKQYARLIVQYRKLHGSFSSLDELNNLIGIDQASLEKIIPYLEIK